MTSIIVFLKDRPLQLHGYLESLLKYSDTEQSGIAIILKETDAVDYSRTIESFPMVKWIKESDFSSDLMSCLNAAKSDHVMFGVDDVVFIKPFQFKTIETFLRIQPVGTPLSWWLEIAVIPSQFTLRSSVRVALIR